MKHENDRIKKLQWLIREPVIFGMVSKQWFLSLSKSYPAHYIKFMLQYRRNKLRIHKDIADEHFPYAIKEINAHYKNLCEHLISNRHDNSSELLCIREPINVLLDYLAESN